MTPNGGCSRRRRAVLEITTRLLSGRGTVRTEIGKLATRPPMVEHGREFEERAAEKLALLSEGCWPNYAVLWEQALTCHSGQQLGALEGGHCTERHGRNPRLARHDQRPESHRGHDDLAADDGAFGAGLFN